MSPEPQGKLKIGLVIGIFILVLVGVVGNSHRVLPVEADPCQQDMTHRGYVNELPMFHCIGHTEYLVAAGKTGLSSVAEWDHIHPWMTRDWHLSQGFSTEQAERLLAKNSEQ